MNSCISLFGKNRRKAVQDEMENNAKQSMLDEILGDILDEVRTPIPPPPDIRDPIVFSYLFENNNKKLRLHFSQVVMDKYLEIVKAISEETGEEILDSDIDCSITFLYSAIKKVKDKIKARRLQNQVKYLTQKAENKAFDHSFAFIPMKKIMGSIVDHIPGLSNTLCQEQGIPEYNFIESVDRTQEELNKLEEEKKAAIADYYKKSKKKPKTEEEIKVAWEEVKNGIVKGLQNMWMKEFEGIERELEKRQIEYKLSRYERMDYSKYESLNRKKSILDESMQEAIVLVRLDLDTELSPIQYEEVEVPPENKESESKVVKKPLERKVVDTKCLEDAKSTLQYLVERMADRILIIGSLGPPLGYNAPEYSLLPISKVLKNVLEQDVGFKETCEFEDFQQMVEDNVIPEGGIYVLENTNFNPSEYGFSVNPETQEVRLVSVKQKETYRERLSNYGKIYVNDAPKASLTECSSICDIRSENMLLGLRMKEMISKIADFFTQLKFPFAAVLAGNDIKDKILLINSLMDTVEYIYLFGDVGLYFLAALGVKIKGFEHDDLYYAAVHKVMAKAKENGIEIVLPKDFRVIKAYVKPEPIVEEKKEEVKVEEVKAKKETAKKQKVEEKKVEEKSEEEKERERLAKEAEIAAQIEAERVWTLEALKSPRITSIPEPDVYAWFLENQKKPVGLEPVEPPPEPPAKVNKPEAKKPEVKGKGKVEVAPEPVVEEPIPVVESPMNTFIASGEIIIGYGTDTEGQLSKAVGKPLKLLWNGILDLGNREDTKYLRRVMHDLLLKRKAEIPSHRKKHKATLIHGSDAITEIEKMDVVVKLEEKERERKERLAALAEDEELESDDGMEDEEEKKGFDISLFCTESLPDGYFTMKLMQGESIPGLLNIQERPRPTRDELECDLTILEDI